MADVKISQLTALNGADAVAGDLLTVVDISDTTMSASGTNKKMTLVQFQAAPVSAGTANGVTYLNGSKVLTSGSGLVFDGSNLGLGATPSAWAGLYKAISQSSIHTSVYSFWEGAQPIIGMVNGGFINTSYAWQYSISGRAVSRYSQDGDGIHRWFNAPSGTAGNAITFTQAMTLDASGNLLVGTTSFSGTPANGITFTPNYSAANAAGIAIGHISGTATNAVYAVFAYAGGGIGGIVQSGTTGVLYNTSSDYRLKNITGPITTSGAYIDSLNPVEGTWKSDGSTFVGLLAHEAQEASRTTVATGTKNGDEMQAMDYSSPEIIANLIAEVKSLRQRLAAAGI